MWTNLKERVKKSKCVNKSGTFCANTTGKKEVEKEENRKKEWSKLGSEIQLMRGIENASGQESIWNDGMYGLMDKQKRIQGWIGLWDSWVEITVCKLPYPLPLIR